jgi:hypothetical protein
MILMCVRYYQADKLVFSLRQIPGVRHHDLNFGVLAAAKADATIDGKPFAIASVQIQVHANLARPAQRQEG